MVKPRIVLLIFVSGKVVLTGRWYLILYLLDKLPWRSLNFVSIAVLIGSDTFYTEHMVECEGVILDF